MAGRLIQTLDVMRAIAISLTLLSLLGACGTTEPNYTVGSDRVGQKKTDAERSYADQVAALSQIEGRDYVPPRVISSQFPEYPPSWSNSGITGKVTVQFFIEKDGSVSNPTIRDSPPAELAAITLHAIMRWKFSPATRGGTPIRIQVQQQFEFKTE